MILSAFVVSVARGNGPEAQWLLLGPMPFWLIGLIGYLCKASITLHGQILFAFTVRIDPGPLSQKSAIVTFLSQLTFANDTPSVGEFRGGNALSRPVGWVS